MLQGADLAAWLGKRAQAPRRAPHGFTTGFALFVPTAPEAVATTAGVSTPTAITVEAAAPSVTELVELLKKSQKSLFEDDV